MIGDSLTRRYVIPLFEVALENEIVEKIGEDLERIDITLKENPNLLGLFNNPSIERQAKRSVAEKVFVDSSKYTVNFLKVVIEKNRPEVLSQCYRVYRELFNAHQGVTTGLIETAVPIEKGELEKIETGLAKRFGGKLELETRVTPEIVGGIRIRIGNTVIDASVLGRLTKLKQTLSA